MKDSSSTRSISKEGSLFFNRIDQLTANMLGSLPLWYVAKSHEFVRTVEDFLADMHSRRKAGQWGSESGLPETWKKLVGELHTSQRLRFRSIRNIVREITAQLWAMQNREDKNVSN